MVKLKKWQKEVVKEFENMIGEKEYDMPRRSGKSFVVALLSGKKDVLVLVHNEHMKKHLVQYGADASKIHVIGQNIIGYKSLHVIVDEWWVLSKVQRDICDHIYSNFGYYPLNVVWYKKIWNWFWHKKIITKCNYFKLGTSPFTEKYQLDEIMGAEEGINRIAKETHKP